MTKRRWRKVWEYKNRELPLWMYYVMALSNIADGVLDLFLLPFNRFAAFGQHWRGYMLRSLWGTMVRDTSETLPDGTVVQDAGAGGGYGCTAEPYRDWPDVGSGG